MVNQITNVCDNVTLWDGDTSTWTPPEGHLMLVQATTLAKLWVLDAVTKTYVLVEFVGAGGVGFTWDGTYLTTNEPQPTAPTIPTHPIVDGAQTL